MPTNRLTEVAIKALKPAAVTRKVSDGGGLHLVIPTNGSRLWRLAYRFDGKQKTLALGSYPTVGLADARVAREEARGQLRAGQDPALLRKAAKRADPGGVTFSEVAKTWFDARQGAWSAGHADRVWKRIEQDLISPLSSKPIDKVRSADVLEALRKVEARGAVETAHRIRQYASEIFRYARAEGTVKDNPVDGIGEALAARLPKKHRAALRGRDLPDFFAKLKAYDGEPQTALALKLTILTFVRTSEVRFARWEEFEGLDGSQPMWRIPAERMKMRNEHLVPLSRQAVAVIEAIRPAKLRSEFVFPAATARKVISENTMLFALYRMGYHSRATVHGFRRTASTVLNENGFNRDWIERQLAHVEQDQVRAAYNAAEWLSERRTMMQWWADYLERAGLAVA